MGSVWGGPLHLRTDQGPHPPAPGPGPRLPDHRQPGERLARPRPPGGGRWWASTVRAVLMHDGAPDPAEGLRAPNEFLREVKGITRLSPSSYRYGSQRTGRTPERLWSTSDRAGPSVP